MKNSKLSDFSSLNTSDFCNDTFEESRQSTEQHIEDKNNKSDEDIFKEYLNSDSSDKDMAEYLAKQKTIEKQSNGNFADILPPEVEATVEDNTKNTELKKNLPHCLTEETEEPEDDFEKIMNKTGFHFDEESGILEF